MSSKDRIRLKLQVGQLLVLCSLPANLTIQQALPEMMRKINLAIEGNYDAKVYYRDRISVKQILRITVNDCLVPNCQIIGDVLKDGDTISCTVEHLEDKEDIKTKEKLLKTEIFAKKIKEKSLCSSQKAQCEKGEVDLTPILSKLRATTAEQTIVGREKEPKQTTRPEVVDKIPSVARVIEALRNQAKERSSKEVMKSKQGRQGAKEVSKPAKVYEIRDEEDEED